MLILLIGNNFIKFDAFLIQFCINKKFIINNFYTVASKPVILFAISDKHVNYVEFLG